MIRAIIFDIYGTLIDIENNEGLENKKLWENLLEPYDFLHKKPSGKILRKYYLECCQIEMAKIRSKYPDIEIRDVFKSIVDKFLDIKYRNDSYFIDELAYRFRELSTIYIKLRDGVIKLLEELKQKDYLLGIVSNTQDAFTWGELEKFQISKYFDAIVYSSLYNKKKPDILLFNECLKLLNCTSDESIYIGNDPIDDVEGGKDSGMKVIFLGNWNQKKNQKYCPDYFIKSKNIFESLKFIEKL